MALAKLCDISEISEDAPTATMLPTILCIQSNVSLSSEATALQCTKHLRNYACEVKGEAIYATIE